MQIKNKKLLVPGYLTNYIYPILLKKNNQKTSFGLKIDNIYSLLDESDYNKISNENIIFQVHEILLNNQKEFIVFKDILENINFIKQFINFYTECIYYEIDINSLPEDSDEEKEIKTIIKLIDSLNLNIKDNYNNLKTKLNEYEVINDFYSQFIEYKLMNKAFDNDCNKYDIEDLFFNNPTVIKKKATTRSKELDDICEYILDNNDKTIQVVAPKNIYMDDIARIFNAYKIPFRRIAYKKDSVIVKRLINFVDFLRKKDNKSLLLVLRNDDLNKDLCDYIEHFKVDVSELLMPFKRFSKIDYKKIDEIRNKIYKENDEAIRNDLEKELNKLLSKHKWFDIIDYSKTRPMIILENLAEKRRQEINESLNAWLNNNPYDALLNYYNSLVNDYNWKEYENELNAFSNAGKLIIEAHNNNGSLNILYDLLNDIKISDKKDETNVVIITDMNHLFPNMDITIVVGANEGIFLPTLEKKEIIKEDYVLKINNYPSLNERLNFSKLKMECLSRISPTVVLSYCYSDYSGKEHKLSSYIENTFNVDENEFEEKIIENEFNYYKEVDRIISKENAEALFIREDNAIFGSVSSLETYQNCPYAYFLQRGLGISDLEGYQSIDASVLGNIRHKIFEILGKNDFKELNKLENLLDEYIDSIKDVFTGEKEELEIKKRMIKDILVLNGMIAEKLRDSDDFSCIAQEYKIENERIDAGKYHFNFNAIVDRIDANYQYFRVIDYKSSSHKIELRKLLEGQQLQLITYLWLLWKKDLFNKEPLGVFYFNLNRESEYNNVINKIIDAFNNEDDEFNLFKDKNKLKGYYIPNTKDLDIKNEYLSTANSIESDFDLHSMEGIDEFLNDIFVRIANNIASGHMESKPSDDTCRYCSFSSICHKEKFKTAEDDDE